MRAEPFREVLVLFVGAGCVDQFSALAQQVVVLSEDLLYDFELRINCAFVLDLELLVEL